MRKLLILIASCIVSIATYSQNDSPHLVSSAGASDQNGGVSISWSLGEVIVSTTQNHQGYQFPIESFGLLTAIEDHFDLEVTLFPNPTSDKLYFETNQSLDGIRIELYNSLGQKFDGLINLINNKAEIDFSDLKAGIYFLNVSGNNKKSSTYKIIKS
jgi:hypothetical protein